MTKTTRFDAADYLDTEERQVAYVAAALESGDADFVRDALGLVARARGMGGIAKKAGLNRESLTRRWGRPVIPNSARSCALSAPWVSRSLRVLRLADRRRSGAGSPEWREDNTFTEQGVGQDRTAGDFLSLRIGKPIAAGVLSLRDAGSRSRMKTIEEPARQIPLYGEYEVAVLGGGRPALPRQSLRRAPGGGRC